MSTVIGSVVFCAGLLIFFLMLSRIRHPAAAAWLQSRVVRELTIFSSMVAMLAGLGQIAANVTTRGKEPVSTAEWLAVGAILLVTALICWWVHRPPPAEESPTPVPGYDPGRPGPQRPPSPRSGDRKAA